MRYLKSPEVAKRVGITSTRLYSLLRNGKLEPPEKDHSGDFVWMEADVKRLEAVLREKK